MTPAPDVSSVLIRLIDAAERVVCCRPASIELNELVPLVEGLQSPVGAPLSAAPQLLLQAMLAVHGDQASAWRALVGALLPLVRDDLTRVIAARQRPLEPDQGYRGGHR